MESRFRHKIKNKKVIMIFFMSLYLAILIFFFEFWV